MPSELDTSIREVLTKIEIGVEHCKSRLEDVCESVSSINHWRHGDGTSDHPGMNTRVDRLERLVTAALWLVSVAVAAAVTALVSTQV